VNITGNTHLELGIPQLSLQTCEIRSSTGMKKNTKRSGSAAIGKSSAFGLKMHFPCRIPHQNINAIFLVCNFFA
jgi:hypothetical protein